MRVLHHPDPFLKRVCEPTEISDPQLKELISAMIGTMYAERGVGLASPQVGAASRIVLIDPSGGEEANQLTVMINPSVTWVSAEVTVGEEGCLSVPGVALQVPRAAALVVEYSDVDGQQHSCRCAGLKARIVQHEVDHLDGVLMIDRVSSLTRNAALKGLGRKR